MPFDQGKQVQPIGIGQFQVEQNRVRLRPGKEGLERDAVRGFEDFIAALGQVLGEQGTELFLIIDQQNFMLHTNYDTSDGRRQ